jgi:hypothetical protein
MAAIAPSMTRATPVAQVPNALQGQANEALLAKLNNLDSASLNRLQNSFYEAAQGSGAKLQAQQSAAFACQTPAEAMSANSGVMSGSYFQPMAEALSQSDVPAGRDQQAHESSPNKEHPNTPRERPQGPRNYGAQSRTPGVFSNPAADKAAEGMRQQEKQMLNFVNNQMGGAYAKGDMAEFLGPDIPFEDKLAAMLFRMADRDQRNLMEQLRNYERGDNGLNGLAAKGAKGLAGGAAAAAGGFLSGMAGGSPAMGAAVGYDIGEKIAGHFTDPYSPSSKAAQFERIKMLVNDMTQMTQMLSNVLQSFASTNKNTISNMRG